MGDREVNLIMSQMKGDSDTEGSVSEDYPWQQGTEHLPSALPAHLQRWNRLESDH